MQGDFWRVSLVHGVALTRYLDSPCFSYHCGALTNQGQLLTWGSYSAGALGHGAFLDAPQQATPKQVAALQSVIVLQPDLAVGKAVQWRYL